MDGWGGTDPTRERRERGRVRSTIRTMRNVGVGCVEQTPSQSTGDRHVLCKCPGV